MKSWGTYKWHLAVTGRRQGLYQASLEALPRVCPFSPTQLASSKESPRENGEKEAGPGAEVRCGKQPWEWGQSAALASVALPEPPGPLLSSLPFSGVGEMAAGHCGAPLASELPNRRREQDPWDSLWKLSEEPAHSKRQGFVLTG